jgi:hypothetical protein
VVKTGFTRMSVSKVDLILVCYVSKEGCVPDRMARAVPLTELRRDRGCLEWRCGKANSRREGDMEAKGRVCAR